jgi:hypothetical protein
MKFLYLLLILLLVPNVEAVALGVNRASLEFNDVLRNGYAEEIVTVTTDSTELVDAEVEVFGEGSEWFNFSATDFNFSKDAPYQLRVAVQPFNDTQLGTYNVNLTITTGTLMHTTQGRMGTSTRASFRIPVKITVTGTERLLCTVGGVQVLDAEEGTPITVRLTLINRGNVRINPNVELEVFDQLQSKSLGTRAVEFGSRVLPTVSQEATRTFVFDLDQDQYWATVRVPECGYSDLMTFDILEPGGVKDDGEFLRIDAPAWGNTGEIIPIKAIFRNKGARSVRASFRGTITNIESGEIVKVINSETYLVDPDLTAEIETFFNPEVGGQYRVSGKVYYNSKLTGERDTLINVNGSPVANGFRPTTAIIIGMIILILLLLIGIRRRRVNRSRAY